MMDDCEAILTYVYARCREHGALWFNYNFTPVFESHTSKDTFIWARDFPFEIQSLYMGHLREVDPVPRLTFELGPILTWTEACDAMKADDAAMTFRQTLCDLEIDNWASFALFGPRNRDGYVTMRFQNDPDLFEKGRLEEIHSMLLMGHLQICKIIDEGIPPVSLSDREREVLEWMGRGKSAGDIATILDISVETVRTYTKRIYEKLRTNDRVSATVRALKLGLVEL